MTHTDTGQNAIPVLGIAVHVTPDLQCASIDTVRQAFEGRSTQSMSACYGTTGSTMPAAETTGGS